MQSLAGSERRNCYHQAFRGNAADSLREQAQIAALNGQLVNGNEGLALMGSAERLIPPARTPGEGKTL